MKQKRYASIDEVIEEIKDIPTEELADPTKPRLISVQENEKVSGPFLYSESSPSG